VSGTQWHLEPEAFAPGSRRGRLQPGTRQWPELPRLRRGLPRSTANRPPANWPEPQDLLGVGAADCVLMATRTIVPSTCNWGQSAVLQGASRRQQAPRVRW